MANHPGGVRSLLQRCANASNKGAVWAALGIAFLALGVLGQKTVYIGIGAAFLAIGFGRVRRARRSL
jgi:hypothetical protein